MINSILFIILLIGVGIGHIILNKRSGRSRMIANVITIAGLSTVI